MRTPRPQEARRKRKAAAARQKSAARQVSAARQASAARESSAGRATTVADIVDEGAGESAGESAVGVILPQRDCSSTQDAAPTSGPQDRRQSRNPTSPLRSPVEDVNIVNNPPTRDACVDTESSGRIDGQYRDEGGRSADVLIADDRHNAEQLEPHPRISGSTPSGTTRNVYSGDSEVSSMVHVYPAHVGLVDGSHPTIGEAVSDRLSSSESESVSGGDSSDGDLSMNGQEMSDDEEEKCWPPELEGASSIVTGSMTSAADTKVAAEIRMNVKNHGCGSYTKSRGMNRSETFPLAKPVANLVFNRQEDRKTNCRATTAPAGEALEALQSTVRAYSAERVEKSLATCSPRSISLFPTSLWDSSSSWSPGGDSPLQTMRVLTPQFHSETPNSEVVVEARAEDVIGMTTETDWENDGENSEMEGDAGNDRLELPGPLDVRLPSGVVPDIVTENLNIVDLSGEGPLRDNYRPQLTSVSDSERKYSGDSLPEISRLTDGGKVVKIHGGIRLDDCVIPRRATDIKDGTTPRGIIDEREGSSTAHRGDGKTDGGAMNISNALDWGARLSATSVFPVAAEHLLDGSTEHLASTLLQAHGLQRSLPSRSPSLHAGNIVQGYSSAGPLEPGRYVRFFPRFAAVLSAFHNGRVLTRETDCRSLSLTSSIMSRGDRRGAVGLTKTEERACLQGQWKLYAIYLRVIKVKDST